MSQQTLLSHSDTVPVLHSLSYGRAVQLLRSLVLRSGIDLLPSEAENMRFLCQGCIVPFSIKSGQGLFATKGFIVMGFVEGQCQEDSWSSLDPRSRRDVVLQVAKMIQQMQSLEMEKPGPVGGGHSTGMWFTSYGAGTL